MQSFVSVVPVVEKSTFKTLSPQVLCSEPNLSACALPYVENNGGPLTRQIVGQIRKSYEHPIRRAGDVGLSAIVDVCITNLLIGQYPDVPGWHCDGVPRNSYTGQPDYSMVHPLAFNVCITLSTELYGVSPLEFVDTNMKPKLYEDGRVFRDIHREVVRIDPQRLVPMDGDFVWYTPRTIKRATPAIRRGSQLHIRVSMFDRPPILNKIGGVRQVYVLSEENGR